MPVKTPLIPLTLILAAVFAAGSAVALAADTREIAKAHDPRISVLEVNAARNDEQHKAILKALEEIKGEIKTKLDKK